MSSWTRLADPGHGWNSDWYSDSGILFTHSDGTIWLFNPYHEPSEMLRYHPGSNTWERLPDVPAPDHTVDGGNYDLSVWFAAAEHGGTVYLLGAGKATTGAWAYAVYRYNPVSGVITQVEMIGASITDSDPVHTTGYGLPNTPALSTKRGNEVWGAVTQFGTFDTGLGHQTSDYGTFLVGFDMAAESFPSGHPGIRIAHERFDNSSLTSDGTYLYLIGGFFYPWLGGSGSDPSEPNTSIDWVRRIDPVSGTSAVIAHDPNGPSNWPATVVMNGVLWIIAGWLQSSAADTTKVRTLDLSSLTWGTRDDFPHADESGMAVVAGGVLYAGLGWVTSLSADDGLYRYSPIVIVPDESYIAEVRVGARLVTGIRMDGG